MTVSKSSQKPKALRDRFKQITIGEETVLVLDRNELGALYSERDGFPAELGVPVLPPHYHAEILAEANLDFAPYEKVLLALYELFSKAKKDLTSEEAELKKIFRGVEFYLKKKGPDGQGLNREQSMALLRHLTLEKELDIEREANGEPYLETSFMHLDELKFDVAHVSCLANIPTRAAWKMNSPYQIILGVDKSASETIDVYLASPLGFYEEGRQYIRNVLLPKVKSLGNIEALDPWEAVLKMPEKQIMGAPKSLSGSAALGYGMANFKMIDKAKAVLANLNGADPDSGTCIEIGYACDKGKLVIGYRTDFRLSGDSADLHVNLQVEAAIKKSGGKVFDTLDEALEFLVQKTSGIAPRA